MGRVLVVGLAGAATFVGAVVVGGLAGYVVARAHVGPVQNATERAEVLAAGISEGMNCAAALALVAVPVALGLAVWRTRARG